MLGAGEQRVLWVNLDDSSPHPYLVESARRAGATVRDLRWAQAQDNGKRPLGRLVTLGRPRAGREHPITLKVVGPRLFMRLARAREDVLVVYELGLVGLYAGLSKALRRDRRVVSLIEGDYQHLGRTGTAAFKLPIRRLAARLVDAFVANNELARDYLRDTLKVPDSRIVVGWWLAGLPPDLAPRLPRRGPGPRGDTAVRQRRPPHPAQGRGPADRGRRGLPARVRAVHALGHRGRPGSRRPRRTDPTSPPRGFGRLPRSGGPCRPQGCPSGLSGVRVPDTAGLHRPCRRRSADHRHAGDRVADDGSGRDDRAGRRERDRRRPTRRPLAGGRDAPHDRPSDLPRPPRRGRADEPAPAARRRRRRRAARRRPSAGREPPPTGPREEPPRADCSDPRPPRARPVHRRGRRGAQPRGDPGHARRERRARRTAVHARDAGLVRPATPGRQARPQDLRHHRLDRHVPHARSGALGRVALRRAGARRMPGGLQHLLEGGLAQADPGRRTRTRARPRGRARAGAGGPLHAWRR